MSSEKSTQMNAMGPTEKSGMPAELDGIGTFHDVSQKALVRRIDYRIVPLLFFCYLMQFLDKVMINVSLSFA